MPYRTDDRRNGTGRRRSLGQARPADIVDALVVLGAARRGDEILTSDPDDLAALAAVAPTPVRITVI